MVKRKRSRESDLEQKLTDARKDIFRALKGAKGLERQRYSKRMRDEKSTPNKIKRLEREILVLKSLDLQQTADAHLNSSILKVKQLAENPALPKDIKRGIPKPNLSEEEKAALHNVTSGLFNRVHVKEAVDKAVLGVCVILNVPIPDKMMKKMKGKSGIEAEVEPGNKEEEDQRGEAKKAKTCDVKVVSAKTKKTPFDKEDDNDDDEQKSLVDETDDEVASGSDSEDFEDAVEEQGVDEVEEQAFEKMEAMLGGSDEEDSGNENMTANYQALLSQVGDHDSADDESNSDEEEDDDEFEHEDEAMESDRERRINTANVSLSTSPPPSLSRKKKVIHVKKATMGKPGQTTFLPSLMGGYISNSESEASDIDVAPPKKRLGQKQRQAIWEKKYGTKANHVKNQAQQQQQKGRDNGWDVRKGAVGPEDGRAGNNKPWKKSVSNPLERQDRRGQEPQLVKKRPLPKKDDEGPLHPSWEARKKAKEAQTTAAFQGTKIKF